MKLMHKVVIAAASLLVLILVEIPFSRETPAA